MTVPNNTKLKFDEKKVTFEMLTDSIDISHLDCCDDQGNDPEEIHHFIHNKALNHQKNKLGFTHIISYDGTPIGYATLAASRIELKKMTKDSVPKISLSTYPAIIIAYLSIDRKHRNIGFADYLLQLINGYCRQKIAERVACRYLICRAKDEVMDLYTRNNFKVALRQEEEEYKLLYVDLFPELNPKKSS